MFDLNGDCVMIDLKTCNNFYVVSQKALSSSSLVFESSKIDFVDHLWHNRLVQNEKRCVILKIRSDKGEKWMMLVSFIDQRIIFIILEANSLLTLDIASIKTW